MKNRIFITAFLFLATLLPDLSYSQRLKILGIEKVQYDGGAYYLKMQVELINNSNQEIIIPNVIAQKGDFIAVSNISSSFFTLTSKDEIFPQWELMKPPENVQYPKLKRADLIRVKAKSSVSFTMNTSYFDSHGFLLNTGKKSHIQLLYQPRLEKLEKNRSLYLDAEILDIKFYEKQLLSKPFEIQ